MCYLNRCPKHRMAVDSKEQILRWLYDVILTQEQWFVVVADVREKPLRYSSYIVSIYSNP